MQKAFFEFEGYKIHYATIGNGSKYLLAFHGYGLDCTLFNAFADSLGKHYTIISFDLFHHGESKFPPALPGPTPLQPSLLKQMLESLLPKLGIDKFGLMGYSMGGRICLYLADYMQDRVDELYLFASDGMKRSYGYEFVTYTAVGRALFRLAIETGGLTLPILHIGRQLRIIDRKAATFFISQVNSKPKRQKLYYSWQAYRLFKPDLEKIATLVNAGKITLHLFCGKYDKILPPWTVKRLVNKLNGYKPVILESGHDLVNAKTSLFLQEYLRDEERRTRGGKN